MIMGVLGRMLARMIVSRFVVIIISVSLFVITLEVLTSMESIMEASTEGYFALLRYGVLRLPGILSVFFTMSLLLAVVLTLVELGYRNEIVPIWAAGITPLQLLIMLLPLGLALGAAHFLLADRVVPRSVQQLSQWGVGEYAGKKLHAGSGGVVWMRAGNDVLRVVEANAQATELKDIIIFRRDRTGLLTEQIYAERARRAGDRWLLEDVAIYRREPVPPTRLKALVYTGELKLAAEGLRSGDPEEMSLAELAYFIRNLGFGLRPVQVYEVWWHRRLADILVPLLMIAVCIPLAARFRRGSIAPVLLVAGVSIGFGFFVFDGLAMTIGELGLVPAWLAGWLPAVLLALLTAALFVRAEAVQ